MLAALERLHGFRQRRAGFGPVEESRVEGVREEFGRGDGDGPQGDAHALDPSCQKGPGQTHHPVGRHPAAGLRVQPCGDGGQRSEVRREGGRQIQTKLLWGHV